MNAQLDQPEVAQHIAEARARWAARQVAAEEAERESATIERQFVLDRLAETLPAWMLEYVGKIWPPSMELDYSIHLHLPGCSPMIANMFRNGSVSDYFVQEPVGIERQNGTWGVVSRVELVGDKNLDEAIGMAASYGESWFEIQCEADRRNAEELRSMLEPPLTRDSLPGQTPAATCALTEAHNAYDGAPEDTNALISAVAAGVLAVAEQLAAINAALRDLHEEFALSR